MGALARALTGYAPPNSGATATAAQPAAQSQPQSAADSNNVSTVSDLQSTSAPATHQLTENGIQPVAAGKILMVAPSGETAYVPPDKVAANEANGAEVGIRMVAPDGSKAVVPFSKQDTNQKNGAKWDSSADNDAAKNFLTQRSVSQSRSQAPGKARVTGPDGMPMLMDVPQGQESSTEAANQRGQAIGTAVGAGTVATLGLGAALAAPGIITEEAATGLVDEFGEPITREIIKQGPSLLGKGFQAASEWAAAHPMTAKTLIGTVGLAGAVKVWHVLSKIDQEFGGK